MSKTWNYGRSAKDMVLELSEGNPGSLHVCCEVLNLGEQQAKKILTIMADMGIRGVLIYVAFTICQRNFSQFVAKLEKREVTLVEAINSERERERAPGRAAPGGEIEWPSELPTA